MCMRRKRGGEAEDNTAAASTDYLDESARAELAAYEEEDSRASGLDVHRALSMIPASAFVAAASAVPKGDACRPTSPPRSPTAPVVRALNSSVSFNGPQVSKSKENKNNSSQHGSSLLDKVQ
eukprot:10095818-Karenia_brevis.AAC.1